MLSKAEARADSVSVLNAKLISTVKELKKSNEESKDAHRQLEEQYEEHKRVANDLQSKAEEKIDELQKKLLQMEAAWDEASKREASLEKQCEKLVTSKEGAVRVHEQTLENAEQASLEAAVSYK